MNIIKPSLLKQNDTIGILAPSGAMDDDENLQRAVNLFKNRGFKVKLSDNVYSKSKYLAGSDEMRLKALHSMFADDDVNAIVCLRGGYGALRLVNHINYNLIRDNAKVFCGYSDVTVLNAMFLKNAGLMTYSGPMALSDFGCEDLCSYTIDKFFDAVMYDKFDYTGTFWGGNLASLVSLCGIDFIPDFRFDFFIEDLKEPVYKIDKMLTQLANIDKFRQNIKSLYVGDFLDCGNKEWLNELFEEYSKRLNIPIYFDFPASHSRRKATIPYGMPHQSNL